MENNVLQAVYDLWTKSEDYCKDSALENEHYEKTAENTKDVVGESAFRKISDDIINLAYNAEVSGFDNGFRYGIMFMSGILKGGAA